MVRAKLTQKRYYESGSEEDSEDEVASRPPAKKKGKSFFFFTRGAGTFKFISSATKVLNLWICHCEMYKALFYKKTGVSCWIYKAANFDWEVFFTQGRVEPGLLNLLIQLIQHVNPVFLKNSALYKRNFGMSDYLTNLDFSTQHF